MLWRFYLLKMVKTSLTSSLLLGSGNGLKISMVNTYQEAVRALNSLQSNAQAIEEAKGTNSHFRNVKNMQKFIERSGLTLQDVDKLSVIHISGTKGKGSTAAFCESILRHQGFKTAFFSSPHLIEVRERFRINGKPISKELFTSKFWHVYNKLAETKVSHEDLMPAYFSFLTVLSCHIFLEEKVDVTIMEVGIGGEHDSTNFIRHPAVCGITSLGLDHTSMLGSTIESIAWNKAGIFKPGVPAVTVEQPPEAMKVLLERSEEKKNPLYVAASLPNKDIPLGIHGNKQITNASLALQLCKIWKQSQLSDCNNSAPESEVASSRGIYGIPLLEVDSLTEQQKQGLIECKWYGRNQTIHRPGITYYLDGAHTIESMEQCICWFNQVSCKESKTIDGDVIRILVFNITGDRDVSALLCMLMQCNFDAALFTPNMAFSTVATKHSADNVNKTVSDEAKLRRSQLCKEMWDGLLQKEKETLQNEVLRNNTEIRNGENCVMSNEYISAVSSIRKENPCILHFKHCVSHILPCISSALFWATQGRDSSVLLEENSKIPYIPSRFRHSSHVQILVTGSLHLVGGALSLIMPNINE